MTDIEALRKLARSTFISDHYALTWQVMPALNELEALRVRVAELEGALRHIADGDPTKVSSPIGPLHAAGIVFQWEIDARIARDALGSSAGSESAGRP